MKQLAKERVIFSNYDFPEESEIRDWIMSNGYDEEDITDEMITNWSYDQLEIEWEDAKSQLENFFDGKRLLLFGSIGRWNGIVSGWETHDDFMKMFYSATEDCDYWKFYDENGHLYLTCSHHDGTCSYEIKELTDDGYEYLERWKYGWDNRKAGVVGKQLVNKYSHVPNFCHKEWGCKVREYEPITKERLVTKINNKARSFYS